MSGFEEYGKHDAVSLAALVNSGEISEIELLDESLPLAMSDDGLPIGIQFAARFGDEATLLRIAGQLEQAMPWSDRRPPVYSG